MMCAMICGLSASACVRPINSPLWQAAIIIKAYANIDSASSNTHTYNKEIYNKSQYPEGEEEQKKYSIINNALTALTNFITMRIINAIMGGDCECAASFCQTRLEFAGIHECVNACDSALSVSAM